MRSMEQLLPWEIGETSHALRRAFDRKAAALGVTRAQWRLLAHLSRTPGGRQVELAERMDIEPITLCRIVDRLEESNLVERRRDPTDRRAWHLYLTDKAEPLVERLHGLGRELSDEAFAGLDDAELTTIRTALARIRSNLSSAQKARVTA
jgi:MarR family transcriptional regulator for hemolysin